MPRPSRKPLHPRLQKNRPPRNRRQKRSRQRRRRLLPDVARRRANADQAPALPSRAAIELFVREQHGRVGKREIARHFGVAKEQQKALRDLLKSLAGEGNLAPAGARRFRAPGALAEAMVVQITGTDPDGDALASPVGWQGEGPPPLILMAPEPRGRPALAPGERVLARL